MKRLLLVSSGLGYLQQFIQTEPSNCQLLFIPTAGNLDEDIWWIEKDRDVLKKMGFRITELDIETTTNTDHVQALENTDVIYVAGGNTFHLLNQLRTTGFDALLTDYVDNGGPYIGASAGALVAGRDIQPIASIDEPEKVEGLESTVALSFVDFVPIPHYDFENRSVYIDDIKKKYEGLYSIEILTDDQAIVVENDSYRIVDSPRSELERQWFKKSVDNA